MSGADLHIMLVHHESDDIWGAVIFTDKLRPPVACEFCSSEAERNNWVERMKATRPWEIN